jgi:hypothetical protein
MAVTNYKIYLDFVMEAPIIPQVLSNNQAKKRKRGGSQPKGELPLFTYI